MYFTWRYFTWHTSIWKCLDDREHGVISVCKGLTCTEYVTTSPIAEFVAFSVWIEKNKGFWVSGHKCCFMYCCIFLILRICSRKFGFQRITIQRFVHKIIKHVKPHMFLCKRFITQLVSCKLRDFVT